MIALKGYQLIEEIQAGSSTLIYRGRREQNQKPVILKFLKSQYPSPGNIARFQQEYEIIKNLNSSGVVKVYGVESVQDRIAIVLEDFESISLEEVIRTKIFEIEDFLKIAIQLASTLGQVHQANIIHKDIKPHNILINPENVVKITDFGIAAVVTRENEKLYHSHFIERTLPYFSPEQTGRMNRAMDYRSDLYSFFCQPIFEDAL